MKPTLSPNLEVLATVEALGPEVKRLLFIGVGCQVSRKGEEIFEIWGQWGVVGVEVCGVAGFGVKRVPRGAVLGCWQFRFLWGGWGGGSM